MEPVRTCVGCRQRANRADLLRIVQASPASNSAVLNQASLILDESKASAGRGAWLHPSSKCLNLAIERRAFGRAFKSEQQLDATALTSLIEQAEMMLAKNE